MKFQARSRCVTRWLVIYVTLSLCTGGMHQLKAESPRAVQTQVRTLPLGISFSQTRVGDILQDSDGFLWMGTQYGLNRYDGFRVRQFLHDSGDANSVGCSDIHTLFKGRDGRLWVSCDQSLDRYEPTTESFIHFHFQSDDGSPERIGALVQDQDGSLWLATRHGILRFNPATGHETRLSLHDTTNSAQEDEDVIWLEEDHANRLWAMTRMFLVRLDRTSGAVETRIPIRYTPDVGSFHEDRWGNFWLIAGYRLYRVDCEQNRLTELFKFPGLKLTTRAAFHTMLEDVNGDMWFGTEDAGIIHISHAGYRPERMFHNLGTMNSLPSSHITALLQDRSGDIWVAFHDTPPIVIQRNRGSSRVIAFEPSVPGGLKSPLATSLFEMEPGRLLINTSSAVQLLDEETGEYSEPFPFLALRDVFDVYRDRQNRLWFATDLGVYRFDLHTRHFDQFLRRSRVYRFLEDRSGRLWILSTNGLLLYSSAAAETFTSYAGADHEESYYAIAESPDGAIWLGGSNGVKRVDVQAKHVQSFPYTAGSENGPSDARVNALRFDIQGRLWVGTQSGLDMYAPQEQRFHRLASSAQLGGQIISCILEDRQRQLWMSSNQGLIKFDPATDVFAEYSSALGVVPLDLSGWGACLKSRTGRLLFGGFGGIVLFTPEEISHPPSTPRVLLTRLMVNNRPAAIGPREVLRHSITFTDQVYLNHSQNDLSVEFTALDFRSVDAEQFRYRLEGLSEDWLPVARGQQSLTFTHLVPKRYRLRLEAASFDGIWHEPGVTLVIDIANPWWATRWMYSVYLLCLFLSVWLAYSFRVRQLAAIFNARTEGRVRERTAMARDLHDTLLQTFQGVILRFAGIASQIPDEDARREELNSALARADTCLIEGREAIKAMRMSPTQMKELAGALEEVAVDLNFLSDAKVEIRADLPPPYDCGYDVDEILHIGREALRNALQHARATLIQVELTCTQSQFELLVTDDGIGIPEKLVSGDKVLGHWGIPGMRERAERIGGTLRYSLRQEGGSEVRLLLPNPRSELHIFKRCCMFLKSISSRGSHLS